MSLCPFSKRPSPSLKWEIALSQKRSRFNGSVPGSSISGAQSSLFQYSQPAVPPHAPHTPTHPIPSSSSSAPTVLGFMGKGTRPFALTEERLIKAQVCAVLRELHRGLVTVARVEVRWRVGEGGDGGRGLSGADR